MHKSLSYSASEADDVVHEQEVVLVLMMHQNGTEQTTS